MDKQEDTTNHLITTRAPDNPLSVQLHPLVLLTISDYVTRHTLRQLDGPMIGAIIGQQSGQAVTLEHAYECKSTEINPTNVVDPNFFIQRLEQYKDVHKAPALDLVGLFMLGSGDGPVTANAAVVKQVQAITSNDNIMLLLFHPQIVTAVHSKKLPISLYESVLEQDGTDTQLKFREVSFEVETGDAEMIGVDFVAKGSGNAVAVPKAEPAQDESASKEKKSKGKGRARDIENDVPNNVLSSEDEELIAALTAKSNAIKMLNQRLKLIREYLNSHGSSYLTDPANKNPPSDTSNHVILRSINAMLSRLPLLAPPQPSQSVAMDSTMPPLPPSLESIAQMEKQDVHLTSLLAGLTRAISEAQSMASKFNTVQREMQAKERVAFNVKGGRRGSGDNAMAMEEIVID